MIIISEYLVSDKGDGEVITACPCAGKYFCPVCGAPLVHRDWKPRIMKRDGGTAGWLLIERGQCSNKGCHKLHSMLPDILVPYKHYASDLITGVLDGDVRPEDPMNEEKPCDATMRRWNHWFLSNLFRMEGYCRQVWHLAAAPGTGPVQPGASVLETLRESSSRWLAAALRMIYNSGGSLVSS